ncbi:MAG: 4-hydroxybenzoate octaprenyltransferase [Pelagibacterales bacterium]|nr:4-hydroxybenzoate octaprenyltransferase [Pelagibacterales bacterium]
MTQKIKNFIILGRFHSPTGALLLAWPCLWGISMAKPEFLILLKYTTILFFGSFILRAAGCAWNDILDRKIDKQTIRTKNRPIASGKLSVLDGIFFILLTSILGLYILYNLPVTAIVISIVSIPLIIIYPLTKRITFFPQIWLGITFNIGILIGYSCITNSYPNFIVFIMYFGAIFWTIGYDTIYAMQDYNDDKLTGVKSTVTKMKDKSGLFASCAYFLSSMLFAIALIFNDFNLIIIIFIFGLGLWQSYFALNTKITEIHKFNQGFNNSNLCGFLIWLGMIINIYFMN